jgi:hypothetical protein
MHPQFLQARSHVQALLYLMNNNAIKSLHLWEVLVWVEGLRRGEDLQRHPKLIS